MQNKAIVWFRNDLRLHDNEALAEALEKQSIVIPVFVFDERLFFGYTAKGFPKIESFRTQFIIESVANLRDNLQKKGADLIVRIGKPEEVIFNLAKNIKANWVFCNRERTAEEVLVQDALEKKLWTIGQELRFSRGKMLYYTADLPFPVTQTPEVFTSFRKEVEKIVPVRAPLPTPGKIPFDHGLLESGDLPDLDFFEKKPVPRIHVENLMFRGGECAGLNQLNYFLEESKSVKQYFETKNNFSGWDYSSKLSPWLALGCLSPKQVYWALKKFENVHGENKSTYWLYFELLWRDFFRLMGKKHGNNIFKPEGLKKVHVSRGFDDSWKCWTGGKTGVPIVDACMIQLRETGFLSNRGRQIAASFLVNDLKSDWLIGAEYFESLLIDYDPCSNYGNWNYLAGVGNDPREDRYFNPEMQAKKYDPDGTFVNYWLGKTKQEVSRQESM